MAMTCAYGEHVISKRLRLPYSVRKVIELLLQTKLN